LTLEAVEKADYDYDYDSDYDFCLTGGSDCDCAGFFSPSHFPSATTDSDRIFAGWTVPSVGQIR